MVEQFGALLRSHRERHGVAQVRLARMVSLSNSMVHLLESGERRPTRDQARRLAEALALESDETDALLAAGGHLPLAYDRVRPDDPDLLRMARTLGSEAVSTAEKARLRLLLRLLLAPWEEAGVDPVALVAGEIPVHQISDSHAVPHLGEMGDSPATKVEAADGSRKEAGTDQQQQ